MSSRVNQRVSAATPVSHSSSELEQEIAANLRAAGMEMKAGRADQAARFYERVLRDDKNNVVAQQQLAAITAELIGSSRTERRYRAMPDPELTSSQLLADESGSSRSSTGTRVSVMEGNEMYADRWDSLRSRFPVIADRDSQAAGRETFSASDVVLAGSVGSRSPFPSESGLAPGPIARTAEVPGVPREVTTSQFSESLMRTAQTGTNSDDSRYAASKNAAAEATLMPEEALTSGLKPYRRGEIEAASLLSEIPTNHSWQNKAAKSSTDSGEYEHVKPVPLRVDLPLWTPKSTANAVANPIR